VQLLIYAALKEKNVLHVTLERLILLAYAVYRIIPERVDIELPDQHSYNNDCFLYLRLF